MYDNYCVVSTAQCVQATSLSTAMTTRQMLYYTISLLRQRLKDRLILCFFISIVKVSIFSMQPLSNYTMLCVLLIILVLWQKAYNNCRRSSLSMDSSSLFLLSEDVVRTLTFPEDWAELDDLLMDGGRGNSTG